MLNNFRYAVRMLRKNPGFTAVAVCSLAVGIGATSAIYSFADGLLLRPLTIVEPSRVLSISNTQPNVLFSAAGVSYPDYEDFRDRNHSFSGLTATMLNAFGFAPDRTTQPHRIFGLCVSSNFFDVTGVHPVVGRGFRKEEGRVPGKDAVAVISSEFWRTQFGASASVLGRTMWLNGTEFTIVGIMPANFESFDGRLKDAVFIPLAITPKLGGDDFLHRRDMGMLQVRGRLRPGMNLAQAQADIETITAGINRAYPHAGRILNARVKTELQFRAASDAADAGLVNLLMALAACVLLIACANVAGLLLSRSSARAREIAVRLAIGARRSSLVRQLLVESLLISLAGGAGGLVIAYGGVALFRSIPLPAGIPLAFHFDLDLRVLVFTAVVSIVSTILFGLWPALRATKPDLVPALKQIDGVQTRKPRLWGRNALVAAQVALSLVLLVVCGLLLQGFRSELLAGPGFRVDGLAATLFDTGLIHYSNDQTQAFYTRLLRSVRSAAAVESAALISYIPLETGGGSSIGLIPEGAQLRRDQESINVFDATVTDGLFKTIGIPIVQGRAFAETDRAGSAPVIIVNEHFARHYWPNQNPLGKTVRLWHRDGVALQVIGVAKDSKYLWIAEPPMDFAYLPLSQNSNNAMRVLAAPKSGAPPEALFPVIRHAAEAIDRDVPLVENTTVSYIFNQRAIEIPNLIVEIVGILGLMALVLSIIGLYGVTAYSVSRRTREIGIRMAVGADRAYVLRMIIRQGLVLASCGMMVGLVFAFLASKAIGSLIVLTFGHTTALPFAGVVLLLLITMLGAAYVPARRASLIDPMRALREE